MCVVEKNNLYLTKNYYCEYEVDQINEGKNSHGEKCRIFTVNICIYQQSLMFKQLWLRSR